MLSPLNISYSPGRESAYNQDTYMGRLMHFIRFTNPMNAFISSKKLEEYKQLLSDFEKYGPQPGVTDKELWRAKYALMPNVHPETGKEIPLLFRMSTFVLVNIPTTIGLSLSTPTRFNVASWQIINQSYNFAVNVVNANATNASTSYSDLLKSYGIAVSSAATVSVAALEIIKKSRWSHNRIFVRLAPFFGVMVASSLNLLSSRYKDTKEGILVKDFKTGEVISEHKSTIAGKSAFWQCAISRAVYIPFMITMVPPFMTTLLEKAGRLPKSNAGTQALNIALAAFVLQFALPSGLAMYPQETVINRTKLEPYFHDLRNANGEVIENFVFNRGL